MTVTISEFRLDDEAGGVVKIRTDVEGWPRFAELQRYADDKGLTVTEAIMALVNSGLSHEPPPRMDDGFAERFLDATAHLHPEKADDRARVARMKRHQ
jgi:hypothetical protein